jgi:hypothetical protein
VGLLDAEVAARHLRLERNIDQRDVASLPAASIALARDRSPRCAANRLKRGRGGLSGTDACQAAQSKEQILDLNRTVEDLKKERVRLDRAIAALEESPSPRIVVKKTSVAAQQPAAAKKINSAASLPRDHQSSVFRTITS